MSAIPSPTTSNPAIDMFSPSHSRCFFEHPDRPDPSISSISMYFRYFKCLKPCISDILSALNPFFSNLFYFFPFQPFRSHSSFPCQPSQSLWTMFHYPKSNKFWCILSISAIHSIFVYFYPSQDIDLEVDLSCQVQVGKNPPFRGEKWWSQVLWTAKTSPNDR